MGLLFPESVTRLQTTMFVDGADLQNPNRVMLIREKAKILAETALRKILSDCIRTKDYQGHLGQTLYLDVCVMDAAELMRLLEEARFEGEREAHRSNFLLNGIKQL